MDNLARVLIAMYLAAGLAVAGLDRISFSARCPTVEVKPAFYIVALAAWPLFAIGTNAMLLFGKGLRECSFYESRP